jgi:molecular chaperone DnaK
MDQVIGTHRTHLTTLLDRWGTELTDAESREIQTYVARLDETRGRPSESDALPLDDLLFRADEIARYTEAARARDALLTAIIASAGRYLSAAQLDNIRRIQENLWQARQRGDLMACMAIAEESDRDIKALGAPLLIVAHARTCIEQGRLSPSLAQRVRVALQDVDDGLNADNDQRIRQGVTTLAAVLDDVLRELEAAPR